MKIIIEVIDHKEQKYETVGNWFFEEDGLHIQVSKLGDFFQEMCIALHEFVEVLLCMKHGISQHDVDKFDIDYESKRPPGDMSEPGDAIDAPYRREHFFATNIERQLIHELGINWIEYERTINAL